MADHSLPVLTSLYADFLSELDSRIDDLSVGYDPLRTTATNQPIYSNRWNSASNKWEQWGGTDWADMSSNYNINIIGTVNNSTVPTGVTLTSTSDKLSVFSTTTSAELAGVVTDKSGTGYLVYNTSPTITTPSLTLELDASPTSEGRIQWDAISDRILVGDGTGTKYFLPSTIFNTDATVSTTGVVTIQNNVISNTKLRDSSALSVIGRGSNTSGDPADIAVTSGTGYVLRESGGVLNFGTVGTTGITAAAVTYAKIQNISATDKLLGRSTAGSGMVEEITCTAAGRALLDDLDNAAQRTTLGLGTHALISGVLGYSDGGTNANSQAQARQNILPDATGASNYVLKTSGPGTYFWAAESGGTTNYGTTISSSGSFYTATAGQAVFSCGTYELSKNQVRVYLNGARLYVTADYMESSTTSITLNTGAIAGDSVFVEVDGYVQYDPSAGDISFSPTGNIASTTVQNAIVELDQEKQPIDPTLTALAGLSTAADKLIYSTASDVFTTATLTSFARDILDDTTAAGVRATIDSASLATTNTFSAKNVFSNTVKIDEVLERVTVEGTQITGGTIDFDVLTQAILYKNHASGPTANWTLNIRGNSSGSTLASNLADNESITITFLVLQGSTGYLPTVFNIDGAIQTVKILGGTAWTADASCINAFTYTIIKSSGTYTVLGSKSKYA